MSELLVRVVDKVSGDPYLDAQCTKRGDVICVQPDGWSWGGLELANPEWRILCLPGVDPADLTSLLAPEVDSDPHQPSRVLQRRAFRIDLDGPTAETAGLRAFTNDATVLAPQPVIGRLEDVKDSTVVESHHEEIIVTKNAQGEVTKVERRVVTTSREVVRYPVEALRDVTSMRTLLSGVTHIGPSGFRANVAMVLDAALVGKITVQKARIADPAIIGDAPTGVIG